MENCINVIAGRPGAGKTLWACREAARAAEDINNTVIYIGHQEEFDRVLRLSSHHENIFFAKPVGATNAIQMATERALATKNSGEDVEAQNNRKIVYLFYDQCRYDMFPGRREALEAAANAGVIVYVMCQVYAQIDKNDLNWLMQKCNCFVVSKGREPRPATEEEIKEKYCG